MIARHPAQGLCARQLGVQLRTRQVPLYLTDCGGCREGALSRQPVPQRDSRARWLGVIDQREGVERFCHRLRGRLGLCADGSNMCVDGGPLEHALSTAASANTRTLCPERLTVRPNSRLPADESPEICGADLRPASLKDTHNARAADTARIYTP